MRGSPLLVALAIAFAARGAGATPTRAECVSASEDAQLMRIKGQLRAARANLLVCSQDDCPKIVKQDCTGWLDEVDRAIPTVVLGARDARGQDLTDVHVAMDGTSLALRLDGKAIPVDPG